MGNTVSITTPTHREIPRLPREGEAPLLLRCVLYYSSEYMRAWYHQIVSFQEGKQCAVRGAYLACQGALVLCMKRSTYMLPCYFSDLITHIIMISPRFLICHSLLFFIHSLVFMVVVPTMHIRKLFSTINKFL